MTRVRTIPAVAAALVAAGGVVWVIENLPESNVNARTTDDDRIVRLELSSTGSAVAVAIARSAWRGTVLSKNESITKFRAYDVWVQPGEPMEFIIIGVQETDNGRRQSATCRILDDQREVKKNTVVVRGDEKREVTCEHKTLM